MGHIGEPSLVVQLVVHPEKKSSVGPVVVQKEGRRSVVHSAVVQLVVQLMVHLEEGEEEIFCTTV